MIINITEEDTESQNKNKELKMFQSYNDYFIEDIEVAMNDWAKKMANEFEAKLSDLIKDKFYLKDMGIALAYSVYNDHQSDFCDDHWLGYDHALCYLYKFSDNYKKEIKNAYLEHCANV